VISFDEPRWDHVFRSQLSPLPSCCTNHSQRSQAFVPFGMRSSFDQFILCLLLLYFVKYKYLWFLCISILFRIFVTDICWVLITNNLFYVQNVFRYSWLFYWSQTRNSIIYCKAKGNGGAIFDWRSGWVIKMTTSNLNYYLYKYHWIKFPFIGSMI
jgi:hypothetical protein